MEEISRETQSSNTEIEKRKSKISKFFFGWVKDNYDKIFIAVLILAFAIRLWIFFKTMDQPFWWDEADYLAAAKKWAGINPYLEDIWYYRRGFLWPLIGSLFFRIRLGEIGMRFLEVLFSTGLVVVSYFLISNMFNKKLALFSSIALSFSWVILFFTGRVLTDIPAAFFALLALLFFWKGYVLKEGNKFLYLFALSFALAILTRMQSFMLAPPFLIYILIKEKTKIFKNKQLWITLGIFLLLLIPQFVLYALHYGNPLTDIASHYLGIGSGSNPVIEGNQRTISFSIFNYLIDLPYILSVPFFILLIVGAISFFSDLFLGLDKLFKNEEIQKKFFVLMWILSLFLIMGYIGSVSYVEQRYMTAALPFLFLIAIYFPVLNIHKLFKKKGELILGIFLLALLIFPLGNIQSNYSTTSFLIENKIDSYSEIKEAGVWIKEHSNLSDTVITPSRPQTVYYSERSTQSGDIHIFENVSFFEKEVERINPRYLVLSISEPAPEWIYSYPEQNQDKLTPVKVYSQNQQPTTIIYEFKKD